tara:strand:+ start:602 stop:1027 length:426 start_codon:yes stop_codon:yes gene_type:complete
MDDNSVISKNIEVIINTAETVWEMMGVGDFEEKHYQKLLSCFLADQGVSNQMEYNIAINIKSPFSDRYYQIQNCRIDILIDVIIEDNITEHIVVELKRESKLTELHEEQLKKYLSYTNFKYGVLINFPKKCEQTVECVVIQ